MQKTVLITGATSGIGLATAKILAGKFRLILTGRRSEKLEAIKAELSDKGEVYTLCFDVSQYEEVKQAISELPEEWKAVDILINNAGNAHGFDPIHEGSVADWDAMIDINVKGLLYVTKEVVPGMVQRKSGHIINLGSIAGIESYPNGNVYNASKYAVNGLSKAMRLDLLQYNIKVSEIKPGAVETEFSNVRFKGDDARAAKVYEGYDPLTAQDIAEIIDFMISRPAHVNLADILVLPTAQGAATAVHKQV